MDRAAYRPFSSLTSLRNAPVSTFRMVTDTSGKPAPVASRTVPEIDAPTTCPQAFAVKPTATSHIKEAFLEWFINAITPMSIDIIMIAGRSQSGASHG